MHIHRLFFPVLFLSPVLAAASLSLAHEWTLVREYAAPEAIQAAAVDSECFYAINNVQIAKYDRTTGRRLALSTGAAKHLNSAFVWHGRLYCAHSNYPQLPELSEIKVLDVQSMVLTTFKDYGGSLTWCVHDDAHWWCKTGSNRLRAMTVAAEEFIRRFLQHVLPSGFQKVRRYGFAHPRSKTNWENLAMLVTVTRNLVYVLTVQAKPERPRAILKCPDCGGELQFFDLTPSERESQRTANRPKTSEFAKDFETFREFTNSS